MYTTIVSLVAFFLLSALIFKKELKENLFIVILIMFVGTLISTTVVNGIFGFKADWKPIITEKIILKDFVLTKIDSILTYKGYIGLIEKDSIKYINTSKYYFIDKNEYTVKFLPEGDSLALITEIRWKRDVDENPWVIGFSLPKDKRKHWNIYVPNDSIHTQLYNYINNQIKL